MGNSSPGTATTARPPFLACKLAEDFEEEDVEVEASLRFRWLRPPRSVIEQQASDPSVIRIFVNGCFDLMHVGHFNVLRQAKAQFYQRGFAQVVLVAGIHSDAAIIGQKGDPLMCHSERFAVLRATKWVDEFVVQLPYVSMSARMADALSVNYICHGDDLPVVRGADGMYTDAIDAGRFQILKRTEGISTTQIMQRLLRRERGKPLRAEKNGISEGDEESCDLESVLATTKRLSQFAAKPDPWILAQSLAAATRVVYVPGTFDLLHGGHVHILEEARRRGDYVLVGVDSDHVAERRRGVAPVLTLMERAMAVLSLGPVNDIIMGAPWQIPQELLVTMNVALVLFGPSDTAKSRCQHLNSSVVVQVGQGPATTTRELKKRFVAATEAMEERNRVLFQKDLAYSKSKAYVPEA